MYIYTYICIYVYIYIYTTYKYICCCMCCGARTLPHTRYDLSKQVVSHTKPLQHAATHTATATRCNTHCNTLHPLLTEHQVRSLRIFFFQQSLFLCCMAICSYLLTSTFRNWNEAFVLDEDKVQSVTSADQSIPRHPRAFILMEVISNHLRVVVVVEEELEYRRRISKKEYRRRIPSLL